MSKAQFLPTAGMTHFNDPTATTPATLTESNICEMCKTILKRFDGYVRSKSAMYEQEPKPKVHGFFRLKTANRGADCHLCAVFLSLFNKDELQELEQSEVSVKSQLSSSGSPRVLLVGGKSLNVNKMSKYDIALPSIMPEN